MIFSLSNRVRAVCFLLSEDGEVILNQLFFAAVIDMQCIQWIKQHVHNFIASYSQKLLTIYSQSPTVWVFFHAYNQAEKRSSSRNKLSVQPLLTQPRPHNPNVEYVAPIMKDRKCATLKIAPPSPLTCRTTSRANFRCQYRHCLRHVRHC